MGTFWNSPFASNKMLDDDLDICDKISIFSDISSLSSVPDDEIQTYSTRMRDYLLQYIPLVGDPLNAMTYSFKEYNNSQTSGRRTIALAKEFAKLPETLPLHDSGVGIYLRVDENRYEFCKALIIGPLDTPYAFGCFEFDLYAPEGYPKVPPMVKFRTTANGTVRFNPNLYSDGKVCLSLLGTWSGQYAHEMWQPGVSDIFQTLVSIQSLILVDKPFFNEPGYGEPKETKESNSYNRNIRTYTLKHAIVGMLESPPLVFEQVIKDHYRNVQPELLATVRSWVQTDYRLESDLKKLEKLLGEF